MDVNLETAITEKTQITTDLQENLALGSAGAWTPLVVDLALALVLPAEVLELHILQEVAVVAEEVGTAAVVDDLAAERGGIEWEVVEGLPLDILEEEGGTGTGHEERLVVVVAAAAGVAEVAAEGNVAAAAVGKDVVEALAVIDLGVGPVRREELPMAVVDSLV